MVLFGATGDLARRKLMGCVFNLASSKLLAGDFKLLGVDRAPMSDEAFRALMHKSITECEEVRGFDEAVWKELESRVFYVAADLTDPPAYGGIAERVAAIEEGTPV